MPTINDENQPADPLNAAERLERERIARTTGQPELNDDPDSDDGSENYADQGSSTGGASNPSFSGGGFYNPHGDSKDNKNSISKTQEGKEDAGGWRGRLSTLNEGLRGKVGSALNNKWLMGAGVGLGGLSIVAVLLLLFMSAYKVPHLMENITTYQFARVFQRAATQNDRVVKTKIALAASNAVKYGELKGYWGKEGSATKAMFDRVDKLNINKVIRNLNASGMEFKYDGHKLTGITLNDRSTAVPKVSFARGLIPGVKFSNNAKVAGIVSGELEQALRSKEVGPVARGLVYNNIRKQLGIGLVAWTAGQYAGKSKSEVVRGINQDTAKAAKTNKPSTPKTDALKKTAAAAAEAEAAGLADPDQVDDAVKNKGVIRSAREIVGSYTNTSAYQTVLQYGSFIYGIALPICIVYDGSTSHAGDTIDHDSNAQVKLFNQYSTVSSQSKDGFSGDAQVIGAYSDKLGDLNGTPPMNVASGTKVGTEYVTSTQTGPGGIYTPFNAVFGGDDATADFLNKVVGSICPVATNEWVAGGTIFVSIAALVGTGGTANTTAAAAGKAATTAITKVAERSIAKFGIKNLAAQSTKAGKFLGKEVAKAGTIAAITLAARQVVGHSAGVYYDGLEQDKELTATLDSGGNQMSNRIMREQFYGRPLNKTETQVAIADSREYFVAHNKSQGVFSRYLAISNPNSLVSKLGMSLAGSARLSSVGSWLNPTTAFGKIFGSLYPKASANEPGYGTTYNNIQWGWTKEELALLETDDYQQFANQEALANSGPEVEAEIEERYGKCFATETTIGSLLQEEDIVRNEDGDVIDKGDCAPINLGTKNPEGYGDLVFRWRVMKADMAGLDDIENLQEVTDDTATAGASTGNGSEFNIASLNVLHGEEASDSVWQARMERSINALTNAQVKIAGLQEVRPHQNNYFHTGSSAKDTYDIYPKSNGRQGAGFSPNPIIWDKTETGFELVKPITGFKVSYFEDTTGQTSQEVPMVQLKDKVTGQEFIVANTHDPADTKSHGDNADLRLANANRYAEYFTELYNKTKLPIFLTGDFNNRYDTNDRPGQNPVDNLCTNLTYRIISKAGTLRDASDAVQNQSAPNCPEKAATAANHNAIDHIFMSSFVQVDTFKNLQDSGQGSNGSDHDTIVAHAIIPAGESTTTDSDTAVRPGSISTVKNLRDAGKATGVIKEGLLFRSGTLSGISDKDATTLSGLLLGKNGTIIDLRSTGDRLYEKDKTIPEVSQSAPLGIPATLNYTQFVDKKVDRQGFSRAITMVANAKGPVLLHCTHGNDRTGWAVAMIMYALGASDSQVLQEYTASSGVPQDGSWLKNGLNDMQRKFGSSGSRGYRAAALKYMTTSIDGGGLGLSQQTLTNLKQGLGN